MIEVADAIDRGCDDGPPATAPQLGGPPDGVEAQSQVVGHDGQR